MDKIELIYPIITTIVGVVLGFGFDLLIDLIQHNREAKTEAEKQKEELLIIPPAMKSERENQKQKEQQRKIKRLLIFAFLGLLVGVVLMLVSGRENPPLLPTETANNEQGTTETPVIEREIILDERLFDTTFQDVLKGDCRIQTESDGTVIHGFLDDQYFIASPGTNGYIAVCHEAIFEEPAVIEINVQPENRDATFLEFGIIAGWEGISSEYKTTDGCMVKVSVENQEAKLVFKEYDGEKADSIGIPLELVNANENTQLRVFIGLDHKAVVEIEGKMVGEFQFDYCSDGPIGLVGATENQEEILFNNLRVFEGAIE